MHRPGAAVAVRVRFIAGKTHAGISVYCAPDTVDLHIQLTAYHHHMFDHPGFVRRGLAQRAGRQGDSPDEGAAEHAGRGWTGAGGVG